MDIQRLRGIVAAHALVAANVERNQKTEYTKIFVTGEWLPEGTKIPAYWNGDVWNGWATPQFTEAGIRTLATLMPDLIKFEAADGIVTVVSDPDIEVKPVTILVDGQSYQVWSIDDWCWEREPDVPAISDDEVLVALVALGEDPTALRVKALTLRVASVSMAPDCDRVAAIQSAVDAARIALSAEVARREETDLHVGNVEVERPVGHALPDVGF